MPLSDETLRMIADPLKPTYRVENPYETIRDLARELLTLRARVAAVVKASDAQRECGEGCWLPSRHRAEIDSTISALGAALAALRGDGDP